MKDKTFLDTNILIYYISQDSIKQDISRDIIYSQNELIISTQVLNEFISVCFKKLNFDSDRIINIVNILRKRLIVKIISENTIDKAIKLKNVLNYSYYDSLILASALENDCELIYSEDFQNSQIIENKLKIANPYK